MLPPLAKPAPRLELLAGGAGAAVAAAAAAGWPCASSAAWHASRSHCRAGSGSALRLGGMGHGSPLAGKRVADATATLVAASRPLALARATPPMPCCRSHGSGKLAGSGAAVQNMSSKSASDSALPAGRTL